MAGQGYGGGWGWWWGCGGGVGTVVGVLWWGTTPSGDGGRGVAGMEMVTGV